MSHISFVFSSFYDTIRTVMSKPIETLPRGEADVLAFAGKGGHFRELAGKFLTPKRMRSGSATDETENAPRHPIFKYIEMHNLGAQSGQTRSLESLPPSGRALAILSAVSIEQHTGQQLLFYVDSNGGIQDRDDVTEMFRAIRPFREAPPRRLVDDKVVTIHQDPGDRRYTIPKTLRAEIAEVLGVDRKSIRRDIAELVTPESDEQVLFELTGKH